MTNDHSAAPAPLAAWLLLQLSALALSVAQVEFYDRFPRPAEQFALQVLLIAQIGASALLLPWLLRTWTLAALVIAASWPFIILASFLAGASTARALLLIAFMTAWLLALRLWRVAARSHTAQLLGAAMAGALVLGAPLLSYLRAEFASSPGTKLHAFPGGPMWDAVELAGNGRGIRPWLVVLAIALLSLASTVLHRLTPRARQLVHRKSTDSPRPAVDKSDPVG